MRSKSTADSSQPLHGLHFSSSTHPHHESRSNPDSALNILEPTTRLYSTTKDPRISYSLLSVQETVHWLRDLCFSVLFLRSNQSSSSSLVASRSHLAITPHLATNSAAAKRASLFAALSASLGALFRWKETRHWAV